jgi:hypothetical protein
MQCVQYPPIVNNEANSGVTKAACDVVIMQMKCDGSACTTVKSRGEARFGTASESVRSSKIGAPEAFGFGRRFGSTWVSTGTHTAYASKVSKNIFVFCSCF